MSKRSVLLNAILEYVPSILKVQNGAEGYSFLRYGNWEQFDKSRCPENINGTALKELIQKLSSIANEKKYENKEFDYLSCYPPEFNLIAEILVRRTAYDEDYITTLNLDYLRDIVYDSVNCLKYADDLEKQTEGVSIQNGSECIFEFWNRVIKSGKRYRNKPNNTPGDLEAYFIWMDFWSLLFGDREAFKNYNKVDMLVVIPDGIMKIVLLSDEIAESKGMGMPAFSEKLCE